MDTFSDFSTVGVCVYDNHYFLCIFYAVNSNQSLYDYSLGDLKLIVVLMYLLILRVYI